MLRKIAFGAGAALAAFGLAVAVPGAAGAATTTPSATSNLVTTQETYRLVETYPTTQFGRLSCEMDAMDSKIYDKCSRAPTRVERNQIFA